MHPLSDHSEFPAVNHLVVLRAPDAEHASNSPGADVPGVPDVPGGAPFAPLMLELMARSQRVAVVEDAPAVMVELHRGGQALVLVEYSRTTVVSELIVAVTRYYPRVSLWQAMRTSPQDRPVLSRIVSTASVSATSQPHHPLENILDDLHSESAHAEHRTGPRENGPSMAIVSDEELAMLMSPFEAENEN